MPSDDVLTLFWLLLKLVFYAALLALLLSFIGDLLWHAGVVGAVVFAVVVWAGWRLRK